MSGYCARCPTPRPRRSSPRCRRACDSLAGQSEGRARRFWAGHSCASPCGRAVGTFCSAVADEERIHARRVAGSGRPGLLAGLSDDDPAGITTYSVLGADHGYQLLWVLLLSTVALVVFHGLAARMGVVTGRGLAGLVRQRFGVRIGAAVLTALVVANLGTTCAEFAGIAAASELFGVSRYVMCPRRRSSFRCWCCVAAFIASSAYSLYFRRLSWPTSVPGCWPTRIGEPRCTEC